MPLSDRDYTRGEHPPTCTCVDCVNKRLGIVKQQKSDYSKDDRKLKFTYIPKEQKTEEEETHEQNKAPSTEHPIEEHPPPPISPKPPTHNRNKKTPNWLIALLIIFSLSIVGIGISYFAGNIIPFWILFGFSFFYSIEKWFSHITRKYKGIGKLYRLVLNILILSIFSLLIWSGIKLFSHQFTHSSLEGSLLFLAEIVFFIWTWRIVSKNSWRWPSMKLTTFSLIGIFLILSFAGVNPFSNYKDRALNGLSKFFTEKHSTETTNSTQALTINRISPIITSTIPSLTSITPKATIPIAQPTNDNRIDPKTGSYKNYYLGLVDDGGFISGDGCYDDTGNFIVLINNKNATNPTYNQLISFLQKDKTDEFPYIYTNRPLGFYYGTAESHVALARVKSIIDGTVQPNAPDVCADFAERLHNDAELAGIRCAYVSISLSGYPDPYHLGIPSNSGHALDAFQTVDRGLVYIDDTNELGPARSVTTVNVVVGQAYIPNLLFNDAGWLSTSMGTVTNVKVVWDGTWNN